MTASLTPRQLSKPGTFTNTTTNRRIKRESTHWNLAHRHRAGSVSKKRSCGRPRGRRNTRRDAFGCAAVRPPGSRRTRPQGPPGRLAGSFQGFLAHTSGTAAVYLASDPLELLVLPVDANRPRRSRLKVRRLAIRRSEHNAGPEAVNRTLFLGTSPTNPCTSHRRFPFYSIRSSRCAKVVELQPMSLINVLAAPTSGTVGFPVDRRRWPGGHRGSFGMARLAPVTIRSRTATEVSPL